ncbi:hypothetical protein NM208_g2769 [Fusarium decemcellulare]|uniref:Uncharacterized protein n=1 Tax=Fusarium decemcellulare TaxID=57161 RepID=A0ACC1SRP6_9HYPO|nr:hypothetical protein NM208_g2769 [Fusarium decemcellulare]
MIPRAWLLLASGLLCVDSATAGPCKPVTTSTTLTSATETESATSLSTSSDTTVVATDSTTSGSTTDSVAISVTITESSTESTTFLSVTTTGSTSSDTTDSTSETLTTESATESTTTTSLTTQASTTETSAQPDSTPFNITPNSGSAASGFLEVRDLLGGDVYFNNPSPAYSTGEFVVNGRNQLVNRGQLICAFFRTGSGYGDLYGCQPASDPNPQLVPINCQLTASEKLQCSVAGKFCYYQGEFLTCEDRGVYSSVYLTSLSGSGYGVIIGPSGLSRSPVELSAAPVETQ